MVCHPSNICSCVPTPVFTPIFIFSVWCWKVYHQPYAHMTLLQAVKDACRDIEGIRQARRYCPQCLARENVSCDVDEVLWPDPAQRRALVYPKMDFYERSIWLINTIKIWHQFRKQFGLHRASIHMPISNNHLFSPSLADSFFDIWAAKGLSTLNDLYENEVFSSFSSLSAKFNLPNSHLFVFFR